MLLNQMSVIIFKNERVGSGLHENYHLNNQCQGSQIETSGLPTLSWE